uniref:dihydrofolate reductase n=1 Tax=viral metagenome TaxID=1070528 RepID=A0A6M3LIS2_9ZZZZ
MYKNREINLIVASTPSGGIGYQNKLPWGNIPEDMWWFRNKTSNNIVIMGRKTAENIGSFLPNRHSVIITSTFPEEIIKNSDILNNGVCYSVYKNFEESLNNLPVYNNAKIFIIGGAQLYKTAMEMDIVDTIYLTLMDWNYQSDKYFSFDFLTFPKWIPQMIEKTDKCEFWTIKRRILGD